MIKIKTIILVLSLSSLTAFSQQPLSLMEAVDIAMQENHDIRIARNNIKIAENNASILNSGYLPSLSASGGISKKNEDTYTDMGGGINRDVKDAITDNYNYGITMNYRLFDGFGRQNTYKKFKSNYTLVELQARATIENTLMAVILSYYQVANFSSRLKNQKRTLDISSERYERAKMQFEFGQASTLDLLRSEVDKNNDSINYINTNRELQIARRNFNVLLARDVKTAFEVDTNVLFKNTVIEDTVMDMALQQNVEYLISKQSMDIAQLDTKSLRAGYIPKVDLSGGYSANNTQSTGGAFLASEAYGLNARASLSWDLFDGGRTHTQVQNAKIAELNAQEQTYNQEINLMREVSNAFINYENSIFIMEAENKNMETNNLNFEYSRGQFVLGQITSIDYRKAQVDLQESINRFNDAKYTAKIAELQLMKLAGLFMQEVQ